MLKPKNLELNFEKTDGFYDKVQKNCNKKVSFLFEKEIQRLKRNRSEEKIQQPTIEFKKMPGRSKIMKLHKIYQPRYHQQSNSDNNSNRQSFSQKSPKRQHQS